MNCTFCGAQNPETSTLCQECGHTSADVNQWPTEMLEWIPAPPLQPLTSRLALASLGFGLISIFPPAGIASAVLGHLALIQISRSHGILRGRDVARLGLICAYVGLLAFSTLFFGAAWYSKVPLRGLLVGPASAAPVSQFRLPDPDSPNIREIHAVQYLVQLHMAQTFYSHEHPAANFACAVDDLHESGFPAKTIAAIHESGYLVSIQQCRKTKAGRVEGYQALAISHVGVQGRIFCMDESGVIRTPTPNSGLANCSTSGTPVQ